MTVNLPQSLEEVYLAEAQRKGVSLDALVADVLRLHVPELDRALPGMAPNLSGGLEVVQEQGVFVLRSGHPLDAEVVDETLESIRLERDLLVRGHF